MNFVELIKTVFGIKAPVSKTTYQAVGFGLMFFKYVVEAFLIYVFSGLFYSPLAFVIPSYSLRSKYFQQSPDLLVFFFFIWSLPFLWIAVTMSIRRAVDANRHPAYGLLVIVPLINLPVMLHLAFCKPIKHDVTEANSFEPEPKIETSESKQDNTARQTKMIYSAISGVLVGGLSALAATLVSVYTMHNYGSSLFMGMPIIAGAVAGFVFNQPPRGIGGSLAVGSLSVLIGGAALLLVAAEGVICLLMAFPILVPVGALGGLVGWFLAKIIYIQTRWLLFNSVLAILLLGWIESQFHYYPVDCVESSVVVDAPIETVWQNVIEFPDIESESEWWFKLGIATPLRATISGNDVGAVRRCEFTTGTFVEPITVWDPPNRLAFDVKEQPDPLIELTPYRSVHPPHLQHSFHSVQGEFELISLGAESTKLIGRTWYVVEMRPRRYWKLWTDTIVHRVHLRVLRHIASHSQRPKTGNSHSETEN